MAFKDRSLGKERIFYWEKEYLLKEFDRLLFLFKSNFLSFFLQDYFIIQLQSLEPKNIWQLLTIKILASLLPKSKKKNTQSPLYYQQELTELNLWMFSLKIRKSVSEKRRSSMPSFLWWCSFSFCWNSFSSRFLRMSKLFLFFFLLYSLSNSSTVLSDKSIQTTVERNFAMICRWDNSRIAKQKRIFSRCGIRI